VALGCFFLLPAPEPDAEFVLTAAVAADDADDLLAAAAPPLAPLLDRPAASLPLDPDDDEATDDCDDDDVPSALPASSSGGFICMILRERVGGGGSANVLALALSLTVLAAEDRRRDLTVSAACMGYGDGILGGDCEWPLLPLFVEEEAGFISTGDTRAASCMAGGGSSKVICNEASFWDPSWPLMSVDEPGVGGRFGLGMFWGVLAYIVDGACSMSVWRRLEPRIEQLGSKAPPKRCRIL
jgi:hypothetical protein